MFTVKEVERAPPSDMYEWEKATFITRTKQIYKLFS